MQMKHLIVYVNSRGSRIADLLVSQLEQAVAVSYASVDDKQLKSAEAIIFISAMGICVRTVAPLVNDKYTDPAVVCVDSGGRYAVSVMSGHIGGANRLTRRVAAIIGAHPVITTQSDSDGLWALDMFERQYGWKVDADRESLNRAIAHFVDGVPCALILECNDEGSRELRATLPPHVVLCASADNIPAGTQLLIAVTPRILDTAVPEVIYFRPPVLTIGIGCRRDAAPDGVAEEIDRTLSSDYALSPLSIGAVATIDIKRDEKLVSHLCRHYGVDVPRIYTAAELQGIEVPNPSEKPLEVTGVAGVAEACAMKGAMASSLLIEKQKRLTYTFAVASRHGHIEIVGAGPGDPKLVSVRGREFLQNADLILYAGSLVPVALTECAREGAVVRSSASMSLDEQFALMKEFYDRGCLVVRLHTGDPCIYGAIQEQMALFDRYGMSYHITPGISAFQAAAAELRSQFTIPERVQSIILTRDEGRTPVPSRERISELARSQSTMCIYLSADLVEHLQSELLTSYPPSTPVAVCYKLTWPQQRIFRGQLSELTSLVRDNGLKLTTLIVVGDAIDNRQGLSKLYDSGFSHLFRP